MVLYENNLGKNNKVVIFQADFKNLMLKMKPIAKNKYID